MNHSLSGTTVTDTAYRFLRIASLSGVALIVLSQLSILQNAEMIDKDYHPKAL